MKMQPRKWLRSAGRARGLAAGLLVLAFGCEASNGPAGPPAPNPEDPSPGALGILEVSVSTTGMRPDADGYAIAVSIEGDPSLQTVGPSGGTVRFPDLPSGTHSVRLESLAPNCSVRGANPRGFTIAAGQTSQISFAVFCPGPGAVLVKTITTGIDLDNDGYVIGFGAASTPQVLSVPIGANDSLRIGEEDLPTEAGWGHVWLEGMAANCWSTRRWRPLSIPGDATTRVEFSVECMPWEVYNSGVTYERVGPNSYGRSEQYILLSNSRFRLRFFGGGRDAGEFLGAYHSSNSTISFAFDEPSWSATGTLTGDSLFVEYNDSASLSDFESGFFVRSTGTP